MKTTFFLGIVTLIAASFAAGQDCALRAKEVKPALSAETQKQYERKLAAAFEEAAKKNNDADSTIWLGRRLAYLGNYRDAIRLYTEGIARFPNDARFYRHRGHRFITLRCFDDAIKDLETAARLAEGKPDEVEPDGLPNAKNIPTSTLRSNIWYHLGLAYYLKGDWRMSAAKFMNSYNAASAANSPDMKVASANWVFMSAARNGERERKEAEQLLAREVKDNENIIENHDYYKLIKLYKAQLKADDLLMQIEGKVNSLSSASLGYGLGNWYLYNGDSERALQIFRRIIAGNQWASFGYIAAEAELTRQPVK
jgi:tetratricopeptide (TPR) repeat protein